MLSRFLATFSAGTLLALGGCAVYVPTVPATPLVEQGQVEAYVGVRSLTSAEVGAAWSPVPHLLVSAEAAQQGSNGSETRNNVTTTYEDYHRQAGVGLGYYRAPTTPQGWYLAALGGVGVASTTLHALDVTVASPWLPIPIPYISGVYEARYWRGYVQVYAAAPLGPNVRGGFSVRGTLVGYRELIYSGQNIDPSGRGFLEPTLFLRVGHDVVQGQFTIGLSSPTGADFGSPFRSRTSPVTSLFGASVIVRPDRLWHRPS